MKRAITHMSVLLWRFSVPQATDNMDTGTKTVVTRYQVVIKPTDHYSPAPGLRLTEIVHAINF